LSSKPNPHVYYFSSSGKDTGESDVFRGLKAQGDDGDPLLVWRSFSADPRTVDPDSIESRAQANPAYNVRIFDLFINVERKRMSEVEFLRERMGIWDDTKTESVINLDMWGECGDTLSEVVDPVCFAIDIPPDSSYTSVAIAGRRKDGLTHVEVIKRSRGTGWVVDYIEEMVEKWRPTEVVLDAIGPAGDLLPSFATAGVDIQVISMAEYGQACGGFKAMVVDDKLRHKMQPGLTAALESARKRPLGESGRWGWNRRDETDISPLVASTLAVFSHARSIGTATAPATDSRMFVFS
jgi:phage terminase large subunit-like protein